jgi:hypothetical protein
VSLKKLRSESNRTCRTPWAFYTLGWFPTEFEQIGKTTSVIRVHLIKICWGFTCLNTLHIKSLTYFKITTEWKYKSTKSDSPVWKMIYHCMHKLRICNGNNLYLFKDKLTGGWIFCIFQRMQHIIN